MGEVAKGWGRWSTTERVVAIILLSVPAIFLLSVPAIFLVVWGLVLYEPPMGPGSAEPLDRSLAPEGKPSTSSRKL